MDIERYKAIFVVLGHKDRDKVLVFHTSRTVRYKSIRILLTLNAALGFEVWKKTSFRHTIKATNLQTEIYINPTERFELDDNIYLKLLKHLYGLS